MTGFKLWLFDALPSAILDNAAWTTLLGVDAGKFLTTITLPTPTDLGDILEAKITEINEEVQLRTADIHVVVETLGAYTPTSACVMTLELNAVAM